MNILDLLLCSAVSPFPFRPNIVTPLIFQIFISLSFGCIFYFVYCEHPGFQKFLWTLLPITPSLFKMETWFTIITPLRFVPRGSFPCMFLERPEGTEDTELNWGAKQTLTLMAEWPGRSSLPLCLPAYMEKTCVFRRELGMNHWGHTGQS